jgi:chloride channel protein, CIC family
MKRTSRTFNELLKLTVISIFIGLSCALLGDSLKRITEHFEHFLLGSAAQHSFLYFLLPLIGLSSIFILRQYLFKKKENKGIKEIFNSLKNKQDELPIYKIPSHYINGFLTVIFGGSTGIEVSTVVAAATIGSIAHKKGHVHLAFRKELICAGVAAGVTALFGSPIAGILFALEVISNKITRASIISILLAVLTAWAFNMMTHEAPLFQIELTTWHYYAIPYFIILGILAAFNAVYLTKCVLFFKNAFLQLNNYPVKILIGSFVIGLALICFPQLYGDGYHAMKDIFGQSEPQLLLTYPLLIAAAVFLLKPLITSITLASGGDGGVFAPSLFIGAFLGLFLALVLNKYFNAHVIPINFMVVGMAAVLSASLHAPYTALFLVCGLTAGYILLIPILIASLVSKYIAKKILPYTVYTYVPVISNPTIG